MVLSVFSCRLGLGQGLAPVVLSLSNWDSAWATVCPPVVLSLCNWDCAWAKVWPDWVLSLASWAWA